MRLPLLTLFLLLAACEAPSPRATCRPRPVPVGLGVAHVAGGYSVAKSGESFLSAGAHRTLELGQSTLKLFVTPKFREQYPQAWPDGVDSLEGLVRTPAFVEVFDLPFETFVLTTVSFSMGVDDPWRSGDATLRLAGERRELEGMLRFLSTRYAGTGKSFVVQNWEGDWALAGGFDRAKTIDEGSVQRMQTWLNQRQAVIEEVRQNAPPGVHFAGAVEANLVLDSAKTTRVTSAVLPEVCTDLVSYSAWEATDVGALPEAQQASTLEARLTTALKLLADAAPVGAQTYLGEFGLPERELETIAPLVTRTLEASARSGAVGAVYWQVFDNECSGGACRGLWLVRPDGTPGDAVGALRGRFWANVSKQ